MADKDNKNPIKVPGVDEMSDIDFVRSIDYLSSPYYKQYMEAHMRSVAARTVPIASERMPHGNLQSMAGKQENRKPKKKEKVERAKQKKIKGDRLYVKKRPFNIALIMILLIIVLASGILSSFGLLPAVEKYSSVFAFEKSDGTVAFTGLIDPVIAVIRKLVPDMELNSTYYDNSLKLINSKTDILTQITVYAVPAAALIILLCAVSGLIMAISALAAKKKDGYYKKTGFGFLGLVILLCALIILFAGMYAGGKDIHYLVDFVTMSGTTFKIGYALYGYIVLPVLIMLLSIGGFKRIKDLDIN